MVELSVDRSRLLGRIEELSTVGRDNSGRDGSSGGVTRLGWTKELVRAVEMVRSWAADAGCAARVDGAGNLIMELPGSCPDLPPLVTGSHLDSVVSAGALDGAYGVVAGAEVLAALHDAATRFRHPLRVVAYANEEGVVAPAFTGSRAIAGEFSDDELEWQGPDGLPLAARLQDAGCDPAGPQAARWSAPVAASVELHIEQGPVLDSAGVPVGVVTAITGQRRGVITVTGEPNHAGTTPMATRHDALVAAASVVLAVRGLALDGPAEVATVGRLSVSPGVPNVVPGRVDLSYDVRAADDERIAAAIARLRDEMRPIESATGTTIEIEDLVATPAASTSADLRKTIVAAATALGMPHLEMVSGAGHDSTYMARLGPMAMIFVPSKGGVSHSPAEATDPDLLAGGAALLLATLQRLDTERDTKPDA